jgi:hypothetical protein
MARPLGCLTGSALIAAGLATAVILAISVATGNGIYSPGELSAARGTVRGGVASHAELGSRCEACHAAAWSGERMADRCLFCHTEVRDEISTRAGLHGRVAAGECRDCHTDHHGPNASLTVIDLATFPHDQLGFSLRAHLISTASVRTTCEDCHPGSLTAFAVSSCATCHQRLDAPYMTEHEADFGSGCLGCHDGLETYGKAFGHTSFPLTGGHAGRTCQACHRGATTLVTLKSAPTICVDCHQADDIHAGRLGASCVDCHTPASWAGATLDHDRTRFPLTGKHVGQACTACHVGDQWTGIGLTCQACHENVDPHHGQFAADCVTCHATTGWADVTFDHATTGFALTGGHAAPACAACHPNGRFAGTPTTCVGCHRADDAHGGSFGTNCGACHRATTWSDATFDHSKSAFPLTGAHASVSCQGCHVGGVFKGTPTACVSCHARPTSHTTGFNNLCGSCHSTKAWTPASFNAPHSFPMNHGGAGGVCSRCHPTSYAAWTCTKCHSNTSMASQHAGVSGYTATGCLNCHPTGSGGG